MQFVLDRQDENLPTVFPYTTTIETTGSFETIQFHGEFARLSNTCNACSGDVLVLYRTRDDLPKPWRPEKRR